MTDSPYIIVNGHSRPLPQTQSLTDFLIALQLPSHVAIAINDQIVPRSRHAETQVNVGDRIEIVQPVGGG